MEIEYNVRKCKTITTRPANKLQITILFGTHLNNAQLF